jgi:hypothetical protein
MESLDLYKEIALSTQKLDIAKLEDIPIETFQTDLSKILIVTSLIMQSVSIEERLKIIELYNKRINYAYPTMANREVYMELVNAGVINMKDDFSIIHEGQFDSQGNMLEKSKPGGFSSDYIRRVETRADYNQNWVGFWYKYNSYEMENMLYPKNLPTWDFHIPFIFSYAYYILKPSDALTYTKLLKYEFLKQNPPGETDEFNEIRKRYFIDNIDNLISSLIELVELIKNKEIL